jgi:hypothetical protein
VLTELSAHFGALGVVDFVVGQSIKFQSGSTGFNEQAATGSTAIT